jgi:hypothetical protein
MADLLTPELRELENRMQTFISDVVVRSSSGDE